MKKLFALLFLGGTMVLHAQTLDDIEIFNTSDLHGTARFVSMGGAFTSLGNDLSAIHINPAAAGVYRNNTLGINLGFQSRTAEQRNFFGGTQSSSDFNVTLENTGFVGVFKTGPYKKESKFSFGITLQKIADFNRDYSIQGTNQLGSFGAGSLADYWLTRGTAEENDGAQFLTGDELAGFNLFEEQAAFQAFMLVTTNDTITDVAFGNASAGQSDIRYNRDENGSHNELAFSFGGQYEKNFYYGISIGVPILSYRLEDRITESNLPIDTLPFDATSYSLNRTNEIYGTGFNMKLGFIYTPIRWWRIGGSYQTPSWYGVNQVYEFSVDGNFSNGEITQSDIFSTGEFYYGLRTPAIYRAGTSFILGKIGLLTFDYEYSDPSRSKTYEGSRANAIDNSDLTQGNNDVEQFMTGKTALRAGAEVRLGVIALRGGYVTQSSFYTNASQFRSLQNTISGGIGYQTKKFDLNLTFSTSNYTRQDVVHDFALNNTVEKEITRSNIMLGANFRF